MVTQLQVCSISSLVQLHQLTQTSSLQDFISASQFNLDGDLGCKVCSRTDRNSDTQSAGDIKSKLICWKKVEANRLLQSQNSLCSLLGIEPDGVIRSSCIIRKNICPSVSLEAERYSY